MRVTVVGTGYVGLVTGACLAEVGHVVGCVDDDLEKIATLRRGAMPLYEPCLETLVARNRAAGRLTFTPDLAEGLREAEVAFICVGTPPLENGEADLTAVEKVTRGIAQHAHQYILIVEKSTVPVQTGQWIERTLRIYGNRSADFDVASNPEFTREGAAVQDFLHPDRLVFGVRSARAEKILRELYAPIVERRFTCPVHATCPPQPEGVPILVTDVASAEMIKHASNSFLALKISFINAVADLCERVGADVHQVSRGMGLDQRIGAAFLRAGLGFGGFCFPKDLQAFTAMAERQGLDFGLLREVERINRSRIDRAVARLKERLWILKGKPIALFGLAFKPETDDVRLAPALALGRALLREGATVRAYDPQAVAKAQRECPEIECASDAYAAAQGAEAVVLCTEWPEFIELDWEWIKGIMGRPLVLDGRNALDREKLVGLGFEYIGTGR